MPNLHHALDPHHVSLVRTPHTLTSLFHAHADRIDPYYEYDHSPVHRRFASPRFNVTETETRFRWDD